jgi:hypothetical protein
VSERLTVDRGRPAAERRPTVDSPAPPGHRALVAIIVLTGLVLVFAAGVAFWMYWLQGSLPT